LYDFLDSEDGTGYSEGYELVSNCDNDMKKAADNAVSSDYNLYDENCGDAVSETLPAGGFQTGERGNSELPNIRYDNIKQDNGAGTVYNFDYYRK
jgi:hypothetical protein